MVDRAPASSARRMDVEGAHLPSCDVLRALLGRQRHFICDGRGMIVQHFYDAVGPIVAPDAANEIGLPAQQKLCRGLQSARGRTQVEGFGVEWVGRYFPDVIPGTIQRLGALLHSAEDVANVPRILAESGIRFLVVEALPWSKVDGASFWLDGRSPVIALTTRFDRIDHFWFVLRHEIEHVARGHGLAGNITMLDVDLQGARAGTGRTVAEEERVANEAAAGFCIPKKTIDSFHSRKTSAIGEADIIGLSCKMNVHPGLVAARLRPKKGGRNVGRKYLVRIRAFVTPHAVTDGWGHVASPGS
jgi:hypothetical protein